MSLFLRVHSWEAGQVDQSTVPLQSRTYKLRVYEANVLTHARRLVGSEFGIENSFPPFCGAIFNMLFVIRPLQHLECETPDNFVDAPSEKFRRR